MADIPNEFLCPIAYTVMKDPVIGSDGHTYDRQSISDWLKVRSISPMTNQRMDMASLKPNFALKSLIENYIAQHGPVIQQAQAQAVTKSTIEKTFKVSLANSAHGTSLSIQTDTEKPMESVIIAVLDTSGSMSMAASKTAGTDGVQFSRLDLVKHSMRTVATLMAKRSKITSTRLAILSFSDSARTLMPVSEMNAGGLATANDVIDRLLPVGATNLWDGIRVGMEQVTLAHERWPNANIHLILLTDGEPSPDYLPIAGISDTLERKLAVTRAKFTLSCFGFGTALDTRLLNTICVKGGGTYGYIPDCSMAGTVFINYCANVLCTAVSNVSFKIRGDLYRVGSIQIGGQRSLMIPSDALKEGSEVELTYDQGLTAKATCSLAVDSSEDDYLRTTLALAIQRVVAFRETEALRGIQEWIQKKASQPLRSFAQKVLEDIEHTDPHKGQLLKAISTDEWFRSWGQNHLRSYQRALELQQCVNFKDAALQEFGVDAFKEIVAQGGEIFEDLPAPKPSISSYTYGGPVATVGTINMANYNTAQGGCWAGYNTVVMADGSSKYTNQIKAGDYVAGGHRVLCVVRTQQFAPVNLIKLPFGPTITPWHPVLDKDGKWVFPAELGFPPTIGNVHYVYNLVLESGHVVQIGDWKVCTLGHGFTDNDVIKHEFFGTFKVIECLMSMTDWKEGLITLGGKPLRGDDDRVMWL